MEGLKQEEVYLIKDLETLRVIAEPLRVQILEMLVRGRLNVRQVAERLGLLPSKLYYHFNMLEKYGLIRVVETRQVSNMIENYYQTTFINLEVDQELLAFQTPGGKENIDTMLAATLDATREEIRRSLEARAWNLEQGSHPRKRSMMVTRESSFISDERADEFVQRLQDLLQEFKADGDKEQDENHLSYGLMVAFYPRYYYEEQK